MVHATFTVFFNHTLETGRLTFTTKTIVAKLTNRAIRLGNTLA